MMKDLEGKFDLMDIYIARIYFVVTFDSEIDRDNVMSKGPMIFDHCLLI